MKKFFLKFINELNQTNLFHLFCVWIANKIPNIFILRPMNNFFLKCAGSKIGLFNIYFISPINIDFPSKIFFGKDIFINRNCTFEGQGKIIIGDNIQIGPNVIFATSNHNLGDMNEEFFEINIKNNVWIGANVVILPGVTLGPNVVVAAGSVVTKNYNNCKIAGIPAKEIDKKFNV